MVDIDDWNEVRQVLNADIDFDDPEIKELYGDMARYSRRADVLETHGEENTAEYFKELAVDVYNSFVPVVQLKKSAEDYRLDVYED